MIVIFMSKDLVNSAFSRKREFSFTMKNPLGQDYNSFQSAGRTD